MSSWSNRGIPRKRNLSQIPEELRPQIITRVERPEVILSETFQIKPVNEIVYPDVNNINANSTNLSMIPSSSYLIPAIATANQNAIELIHNGKTYVFVILRNIRTIKDNELWITSYNSIRKYYKNKIVIIDDNSSINTVNGRLVNTEVIQSEFNGAGEFLPYYYFLMNKWADCMIFLHDSMFLHRPFYPYELDGDIKFHWHFSKNGFDNDSKLENYVSILNNNKELMNYIKDPSHSWKGCFGTASIIDLSVVEYLQSKYMLFTSLAIMIRTRKDRESFERLFGNILYYEGKVDDTNCSNFGDILNYPNAFEAELTHIETISHLLGQKNYNTAIVKVWRGR